MQDREEASYDVSFKDGVGRCVVAARDLEPLELIMEDDPAATGPEEFNSNSVCITCCRDLGARIECHRCERCGIEVCSKKCSEDETHSECECEIVAERKGKFDVALLLRTLLCLRLLLLEGKDPKTHSEIMKLMDHNDERKRRDPTMWNKHQTSVVDFIRNTLGLGERFSSEEIIRCIGIIRTNGISLTSGESKLRCVYPSVSLLSHGCVANARCIRLRGNRIRIVAQTAILAGEEIVISYTSMLSSTRKRRELLRDNWCFSCECKRCSDPTELGSMQGAIRCSDCSLRFALFDHAKDVYRCGCGAVTDAGIVVEMETALEAEVSEAEASGSVERHERLLDNLLEKLHENHHLTMRTKSQLISLYGNTPGLEYQNLSREKLARKRGLCEEFLKVYTKVDPGSSDWRGSTLFELAMTRAELAQRDFLSTNDVKKFRSESESVSSMLEEVHETMAVEEEGTYARQFSERARKNLAMVRDMATFAEFIL